MTPDTRLSINLFKLNLKGARGLPVVGDFTSLSASSSFLDRSNLVHEFFVLDTYRFIHTLHQPTHLRVEDRLDLARTMLHVFPLPSDDVPLVLTHVFLQLVDLVDLHVVRLAELGESRLRGLHHLALRQMKHVFHSEREGVHVEVTV